MFKFIQDYRKSSKSEKQKKGIWLKAFRPRNAWEDWRKRTKEEMYKTR